MTTRPAGGGHEGEDTGPGTLVLGWLQLAKPERG